jgi:hypothetical protein
MITEITDLFFESLYIVVAEFDTDIDAADVEVNYSRFTTNRLSNRHNTRVLFATCDKVLPVEFNTAQLSTETVPTFLSSRVRYYS